MVMRIDDSTGQAHVFSWNDLEWIRIEEPKPKPVYAPPKRRGR